MENPAKGWREVWQYSTQGFIPHRCLEFLNPNLASTSFSSNFRFVRIVFCWRLRRTTIHSYSDFLFFLPLCSIDCWVCLKVVSKSSFTSETPSRSKNVDVFLSWPQETELLRRHICWEQRPTSCFTGHRYDDRVNAVLYFTFGPVGCTLCDLKGDTILTLNQPTLLWSQEKFDRMHCQC